MIGIFHIVESVRKRRIGLTGESESTSNLVDKDGNKFVDKDGDGMKRFGIILLLIGQMFLMSCLGQDWTMDELDSLTARTDTTIMMLWENDTLYKTKTYDAGEYVHLLRDTFLYFAPVIGLGNDSDTVGFSYQDVIYGTKWKGSHTLVLSEVSVVLVGSSPDIDINIYDHATMKSGSGAKMLTTDLTVTSTTTGNSSTTFTDSTIITGEHFWVRVEECTTQPTQAFISIYGYLIEP